LTAPETDIADDASSLIRKPQLTDRETAVGDEAWQSLGRGGIGGLPPRFLLLLAKQLAQVHSFEATMPRLAQRLPCDPGLVRRFALDELPRVRL
jgi:hypothetical protein